MATDEVMANVPTSRLGSASSTQQLIWRCVDAQTGQIVPSSTQVRSMPSHGSAPGGPAASRPVCLPLHFCSIPVGPGPNDGEVTSGDSTARALLTVAQRTSSRSAHDFSHSVSQRGPPTSPVISARYPDSSVAHPARQSSRMSQIPLGGAPIELGLGISVWGLQNTQSDVPPFGVSPKTPDPCLVSTPPTSHVSVMQSPVQFHGVPPPPPHQRPYPSTCAIPPPIIPYPQRPAPEGPTDDASSGHQSRMNNGSLLDPPASTNTPFSQLRAAPDRKSSDPTSAIVNRRRGVVSQFPAGSHDYSIVNTEPPTVGRGPNHGRVISQVIDRRQTQPVPGFFPDQLTQKHMSPGPWNGVVRRGEYWPNYPLQNDSNISTRPLDKPTSSPSNVVDKSHLMLPLLSNKATKPGDLRPISLSSTDSFLAAERACAASDLGDDLTVGPIKTSSSQDETHPRAVPADHLEDDLMASHHNPMYTDNEYDSMTESQGNLVDAGARTPSNRAARSYSNPPSRPLQRRSGIDYPTHNDHMTSVNTCSGLPGVSSPSVGKNNIRNAVNEVSNNATSAG
ncbi:unnamed protein product [Echinostoma caproni]|uniref:Uncharacterized protein n=1 Tax=Echinostoma caproni TaxID=27848 RepID=A0A3P8GW80_9TREM|nr:unnamed protein product [Echinostoma caproni]